MNALGFAGLPGHTEIILIIFVIVLLFGAKKLPELSRSLGKSLGEFKKGQKEGSEPDTLEDGAEQKEISASDKSENNELDGRP